MTRRGFFGLLASAVAGRQGVWVLKASGAYWGHASPSRVWFTPHMVTLPEKNYGALAGHVYDAPVLRRTPTMASDLA